MNTKRNDDIRKFKAKYGISMNASIKADEKLKKEFVKRFSKHTGIVPVWANREELLQTQEEPLCFLEADVKNLLENSDFDTRKVVNRLSQLEVRHIKLLERWIEKNPVDPPFCNYSDNGINILEGNHRIALCVFLKVSKMQILVPQNMVDVFKDKFGFELINK